MKIDSIQDSTRYVVEDIHKGSIMPGNRAEMWRNIYLDSGAKILGGIWGGEIQISGGNVYIEDSIYIRGSINIKNENKESSQKDEVEFGSVVVSPESLFMENNAPRTRFNSDIYIGQLSLNNAIIYGNIYASNASLENCIVLGGVYCRGKLEISNSIVFMFKTKTLRLNENVSLLAPYSISEEKFEIEHPVKALTFFNLLNDKNNNSGGAISLDDDDIFRVKYNEAEVDDEDNKELNLPPNVYILSIVERILNSTKIIEQFRKNKELIEFLAFGNNMLEEFSDKFKDFTRKDLEKSLWDIIDKGISKEDLNGSSGFDELVNLFKTDGPQTLNKFEKINKKKESIPSDGTESQEGQILEENSEESEMLENITNDTQIKCSKCGEVNRNDVQFCISCGNQILVELISIENAENQDEVEKSELDSSLIICSQCGDSYSPEFAFCPACGVKN